MSGPRILLVADAGPAVGGGHVMRSLTLAQALKARGATCVFLATPGAKAVLQAFGPAIARIDIDPPTLANLVERAADHAVAFDAVVIDHYGLSGPDHQRIARSSAHGGKPSLVIDDLANRPLVGDLILDSGPARQASDYDSLIPAAAELLLGPDNAPVRPAFPALREAALARRATAAPVRRILVSLGLTDVGAISRRVVDLTLPLLDASGSGEAVLDVVLGGGAPSLAGLRALVESEPRLALHVDAQDMPRLILEADLAIGAGGSSSWERCVLALPTLLLILADNQRAAALALARADAALTLDVAGPDFETAFAHALTRLLTHPPLRDRLSAASAAVCDGGGAARIAERFLALIAQRGAEG